MTRLTVRMVTATLSPGDAIGHYIMSLRRLLQEWGAKVELYADQVHPAYRWLALPSLYYPRDDHGLLWYHYSIYSDNIAIIAKSVGYRLLDYHGISPPHLFAGENEKLAALCRLGQEELPRVAAESDYLVAHSSYTAAELRALGMENVVDYPLFVDTSHFSHEDDKLARLLACAEYLLFVGRIVPQKNIQALLAIFAEVQKHSPNLLLILAGTRDLASRYQATLDAQIDALGLTQRVLFTGQVNDPAALAALYRHARMTVIASEWESFCVPVAESLYFHTPVAVNNVPPLPEVAGAAGIIFDSKNPAAAAELISAVLEDRVKHETLRRAASSQAARYSGIALAQNVRLLLERVASDSRPTRRTS